MAVTKEMIIGFIIGGLVTYGVTVLVTSPKTHYKYIKANELGHDYLKVHIASGEAEFCIRNTDILFDNKFECGPILKPRPLSDVEAGFAHLIPPNHREQKIRAYDAALKQHEDAQKWFWQKWQLGDKPEVMKPDDKPEK